MAAKDKKKRPYYVDNKAFLQAMIEYREMIEAAKEAGKERPNVPFYVADCIIKIATHLSYKPNFINYSFREDMIMDGVENCLQYIDNFNPEKSKNPFAYFTQIIYYAFLRRIQKEKKYLYVKMKATEQATLFGDTSDSQAHDAGTDYSSNAKVNDWNEDYVSNFVANFEQNKRKKVKKKRIIEEE